MSNTKLFHCPECENEVNGIMTRADPDNADYDVHCPICRYEAGPEDFIEP